MDEGTWIVSFPVRLLIITCNGRGSYRRTVPDRHGFPRPMRPGVKQHFKFATGDLAIATVPSGKRAGTHAGRIAIRSDGYFNVRTACGLVPAIHHRLRPHVQLSHEEDDMRCDIHIRSARLRHLTLGLIGQLSPTAGELNVNIADLHPIDGPA
ncbi:hypothetical protein [Streptomyces sp. NPDC002205]|uniref:hypothetical protein n=1 Tax=Streptomyces sp. NPDC002205 TaxID=3154411 RepID=UPI00332A9ACA